MTDSLRILHLSDTHLFGDGRLHYGIVDTLGALDRVLARAASLTEVDAVVVSGDLSEDGSAASYRRLKATLDPWAAERGAVVVYAMGNHDLRDGFEEVLGDRETEVSVRGFRIITVDTSVPGAGYGKVTEAQLDRLRETLSTPAEHGTVVVLHHPPVPPTTVLFEPLRLVEPEPLLEMCAGGGVRLILAGHFHHGLVTEAGGTGIPVVVAPAVANTTDVLWPPPRERAVRGAGFAWIQLPADGPMRAHMIAAPAKDDGETVYDLDAEAIRRIADDAGWRR
ncbi:metallophosphoesterase [Leifsonia shinshuensis]|uniref:metallophosphoesterase n=1 Tax=Leifsonia shinshuensis TaxID=150026 RepID=UPI002855E401|nr:metallophosphoesterase [Leifsonia shinshuensis]MDR6971891.1 3',5'-cyclic AMP phosphodiesterase CpdA [Leifsonia shinshuensis]